MGQLDGTAEWDSGGVLVSLGCAPEIPNRRGGGGGSSAAPSLSDSLSKRPTSQHTSVCWDVENNHVLEGRSPPSLGTYKCDPNIPAYVGMSKIITF